MMDIIKAIEASGYNWIGIRHLADDENYQIGDYCRNSYDWNYEYDCSTYDTDEPQELPGTCAYNTKIDCSWDDPEKIAEKLAKAIENANYIGTPVIIGGDRAEYGNDEGEIIIADAVVIAYLDSITTAIAA
ncbi:hypothetical protein [Enterocloster asparagiformis]|uniref:hypothetical protein n=1 Tax=Enterocloster asparagiformis TaxID=333367 RepID=UPI00046490C2|nr:hypothetical protein [Enterocloster asparagiformis]